MSFARGDLEHLLQPVDRLNAPIEAQVLGKDRRSQPECFVAGGPVNGISLAHAVALGKDDHVGSAVYERIGQLRNRMSGTQVAEHIAIGNITGKRRGRFCGNGKVARAAEDDRPRLAKKNISPASGRQGFVQGVLLQKGQNLKIKRRFLTGPTILALEACGQGQIMLRIVETVQRQGQLLDVIGAFRFGTRFPHRLDGRDQQSDQNRYDGDYHQQFD